MVGHCGAILCAALLLAAAGCKKEGPPKESPERRAAVKKGDAGVSPPVEAVADGAPTSDDAAVAADDPPSTQERPSVSARHPLARLAVGQNGSKAAMAALLPGYQVRTEETAIEEGMRQIIEVAVSKGGKRVAFARVEKGKVFEVRIFDPTFSLDKPKTAPGQVFTAIGSIKGCGCQGEEGMDGFHCELATSKYMLVFETKELDCALITPAKTRAAVKGRTVIALALPEPPEPD